MPLQNTDNPFRSLKFRYLVLRFIVVSLITTSGLIFLQTSGGLKLNQQDSVIAIYIVQFVLLCLWSVKDFERLRAKLKYVVGDFPKNYNWLWLAWLVPLAIIFSLSAFIVLFYLLSLAAPYFVEQLLRNVANTPTVENSNSLASNLLVSLAFCIVAPVTEEFLFRGIILQRWATKWGIRAGLLSSSLLFGFLHPQNPIGLTLLGIILGLLYIKTRSLIMPIAFHALNNILAVSSQLLPSDSSSYEPAQSLQNLINYWWLGLLMMSISLPILLRFVWKNWPPKDTMIPYLSNANKDK
ncbi:putative metal-dependent membrane protease [Rivularia sp. PCC 7116]|uniref:CPBP family intramembrane glutamic endopeptidase n=1 Tax=Rivularia sp. PCC 7116 TaxID=373994 RepID=UPI00029F204C|nr:type II CAAX endopeptidase family protein [Rivularia sp. PCC 7116]AFY56611.1 putative metal-dependent membrane protease [Rivularia sp. PCC 7116]